MDHHAQHFISRRTDDRFAHSFTKTSNAGRSRVSTAQAMSTGRNIAVTLQLATPPAETTILPEHHVPWSTYPPPPYITSTTSLFQCVPHRLQVPPPIEDSRTHRRRNDHASTYQRHNQTKPRLSPPNQVPACCPFRNIHAAQPVSTLPYSFTNSRHPNNHA